MKDALLQRVEDGLIPQLSHLSEVDLLAAGSYAKVFCGGVNRVLRLTTEDTSHHALVFGHLAGLAVPVCYQDYGAIGEDDSNGWPGHIWLAELERLEPLTPGSRGMLEVDAIIDALGREDIYFYGELPDLPLEKLFCTEVSPRVRRTVLAMIAHASFIKADLDLRPDNFMWRPNPGELLVTDLITGSDFWEKHSAMDWIALDRGPERLFQLDIVDKIIAESLDSAGATT